MTTLPTQPNPTPPDQNPTYDRHREPTDNQIRDAIGTLCAELLALKAQLATLRDETALLKTQVAHLITLQTADSLKPADFFS